MHIKLLAVGRLREKYWREAVKEYEKRLTAYCKLETLEVKESSTENKEAEGRGILEKIHKEDWVIALDVEGKTVTSPGLSQKLEALAMKAPRNLVFVIGGSRGLSKDVLQRADERLSFSALTFPHQMIRVFLLEQIYRSYKILRKEKYHK